MGIIWIWRLECILEYEWECLEWEAFGDVVLEWCWIKNGKCMVMVVGNAFWDQEWEVLDNGVVWFW